MESIMESLFKNYSVYIIGQQRERMSPICRSQFAEAEKLMQYAGFKSIINPITALDDISISKEEAIKRNISNLIHADAVFVMSNTSSRQNENMELKIALDLNLMVIHDKVQFPEHFETALQEPYYFSKPDEA